MKMRVFLDGYHRMMYGSWASCSGVGGRLGKKERKRKEDM